MPSIFNKPVYAASVPGQNSSYEVYNDQVTIHLDRTSIDAEPGAFVAGQSVTCDTQVSGGLWNSIGKLFFGTKSIFSNTFNGHGQHSWICLAPPERGQIASYGLKSTADKIFLVAGSYLASTKNVQISTKFEGFFNLKGMGHTVIEASLNPENSIDEPAAIMFHSEKGSMLPVDVTPDKPLLVETSHIIGYTGVGLNANYKLLNPTATGLFFSGQRYVVEFTGKGTVFVRSHLAKKFTPVVINNYTNPNYNRYDF